MENPIGFPTASPQLTVTLFCPAHSDDDYDYGGYGITAIIRLPHGSQKEDNETVKVVQVPPYK